MENKIRIAIQKEGRLKKESEKFLRALGLRFKKDKERRFVFPSKNGKAEILYLRHSDIPCYVESGTVDFGIVGENLLYENEFNVKLIKKLGFGQCQLVIAVPKKSLIENISDLKGKRIATSHPNSLRKFLKKEKTKAIIIKLKGAVEVAPRLGLADVICDLTQTGRTLRENQLRPIITLFNSEAVLIESPLERKEKKEFFKKFLQKIL